MTASAVAAAAPRSCARCGTQLGPNLLSCPSCHALVHADALRRLAADAEAAAGSGDPSSALARWREALELLPAHAVQREAITARIGALTERLDEARRRTGDSAAGVPWWKRGWAAMVAMGALVLGKLKFLLLGLTKAKTLLSMVVYFGVRSGPQGWLFAAGLVLCIYVHEMGHVAELARYGIRASAPMFIPGIGALVMLRQHPANPRENARVGLAGPLWGLGATLAVYAVSLFAADPLWRGLARASALINLFNLIPVWQLDGSRGFASLTLPQRRVALLAVAATLVFSARLFSMPFLLWIQGAVAAFALIRALDRRAPAEADPYALRMYVGLVVALSVLAGF